MSSSSQLFRNIGIFLLVTGLLLLGFVLFVFINQSSSAAPETAVVDLPLSQREAAESTLAGSAPDGPFDAVVSQRQSELGSAPLNSREETFASSDRALSPSTAAETSSGRPGRTNEGDGGTEVILETERGRERINSTQQTLGGFIKENNLTLFPSDKIYADGQLIDPLAVDQVPLPAELSIGRFVSITVVDEGFTQVIRTGAESVGEALLGAEITLFAADQTEPHIDSAILPEMTVTISRSFPVTLQVDGEIIQTRTTARQASAVAQATGVSLYGQDFVTPGDDQPLAPNQVIQVVRVTEDFVTVDEEIPFETLWQGSDQLELDERGLLQAGVTGIKRTRYRIRYENGQEVGRQPDGELIVQEAQDEIMGYGTRVVIRTINTENGPVEYYRKVQMRVTSYMAQTSGKPPDHPAYGITASGVVAGYGVVAIDPKVVPFRSNVYVPGYGTGFAGDTGGGVKGRWIDLGYEDNWDTFEHWSGYVDVYYLTPVPETINYLLPTNLP